MAVRWTGQYRMEKTQSIIVVGSILYNVVTTGKSKC